MQSGALSDPEQPTRQGRQQEQGPKHIEQEHESQQDAHICLKLQGREDPGRCAYGQGNTGDQNAAAGDLKCLVISLVNRHTLVEVRLEATIDIDAVIDADTDTKSNDRQG